MYINQPQDPTHYHRSQVLEGSVYGGSKPEDDCLQAKKGEEDDGIADNVALEGAVDTSTGNDVADGAKGSDDADDHHQHDD